jgi:hypothetical protein
LVAAMSRTSARIVSTPPRRMNSRSWITRSSLAWVSTGMLPISSKKIEPPAATSNRPFLFEMAPVKEPLTWPKRFDSSRSAGIEPELTVTKGPSARREWWWIALATSSLPVPLSPRIRMFDLAGAASEIRSNTCCIGFDLPTRLSKPKRCLSCWRSERFSLVRRRCSSPLRRVSSTSSFLNGFGM